jgi:hypothetical protein
VRLGTLTPPTWYVRSRTLPAAYPSQNYHFDAGRQASATSHAGVCVHALASDGSVNSYNDDHIITSNLGLSHGLTLSLEDATCEFTDLDVAMDLIYRNPQGLHPKVKLRLEPSPTEFPSTQGAHQSRVPQRTRRTCTSRCTVRGTDDRPRGLSCPRHCLSRRLVLKRLARPSCRPRTHHPARCLR